MIIVRTIIGKLEVYQVDSSHKIKMDIESLKLFCDVIKLKGFTQAAAAHSITQSAVSQRLKSLEKRFGTPLIERHGAALHLTKAGEHLYKAGQHILAELAEMEEHVLEIGGSSGGTVKISAIYSVGLYELDPFLKKFLKLHPGIEVQMAYDRATTIYQDVINGSIDLGVVAYPPNKPGLDSIPLSNDELVLICHPGHPLAHKESISMQQLNSQPLVTFQRDIPTRKALDAIFKKHGVSVVIKAEFDNIELIKRAVEIGLGTALVPSITVISEVQAGILKELSLAEGPFTRPIAVLHRRRQFLRQPVKKFLNVLTENRL